MQASQTNPIGIVNYNACLLKAIAAYLLTSHRMLKAHPYWDSFYRDSLRRCLGEALNQIAKRHSAIANQNAKSELARLHVAVDHAKSHVGYTGMSDRRSCEKKVKELRQMFLQSSTTIQP